MESMYIRGKQKYALYCLVAMNM